LIGGVRLTRAFLRLIFGTPLPYDNFRQIRQKKKRFCDKTHVLSCFGDAGYVLGYPFIRLLRLAGR